MSDRIWTDAIQKIQDEAACRNCGRTDKKLDCAHVSGRSFDRPKPGKKTKWVDPDDVIPLCGPFGDKDSCHTKYDHHQLSIISSLSPPEQLKAVQNFGTIELARRRLDALAFKQPANTIEGETR